MPELKPCDDYNRVDDLTRLLDNKWTVQIYRNSLGSYTAVALKAGETVDDLPDDAWQITDDFTPSKALYRLSEKMIGNIVDSKKETPE